MKRILTAALCLGSRRGSVFAATALGQSPPPRGRLAATQVFIWADTLDRRTGKQGNAFNRGDNVIFRAYAVDMKTKTVVTPATAQYFYVEFIPTSRT